MLRDILLCSVPWDAKQCCMLLRGWASLLLIHAEPLITAVCGQQASKGDPGRGDPDLDSFDAPKFGPQQASSQGEARPAGDGDGEKSSPDVPEGESEHAGKARPTR